MEFLLTKLPAPRCADIRTERIKPDIAVRQGRSLEKAARPQKPATSFMARIRNYVRNLFFSAPSTVHARPREDSTDREATGGRIEPRLRVITEIYLGGPDIPENMADIESSGNFLLDGQVVSSAQQSTEPLTGASSEKSVPGGNWTSLLSETSRQQLEKVSQILERQKQMQESYFSFKDFRTPAATGIPIAGENKPLIFLSKEDCEEFSIIRLAAFENAMEKQKEKLQAVTGDETGPSNSIDKFREVYSKAFDTAMAECPSDNVTMDDLLHYHLSAASPAMQAAVKEGIAIQEISHDKKGAFIQAANLACKEIDAEIARIADAIATSPQS